MYRYVLFPFNCKSCHVCKGDSLFCLFGETVYIFLRMKFSLLFKTTYIIT